MVRPLAHPSCHEIEMEGLTNMTTRWRASVLYAATITEITDEQADALMRRLPGYGIATSDGRHVRLEMTVEASTLRKATDEALKAAAAAYADAFDSVGTPAAVRVLTEEESQRELGAPVPLELVGVAEIGEMIGASRQRAQQVTDKPGFPAPVAELRSGRVYTLGSVRRFLEGWSRQTGRPRKAI